jgi:hypothetical protein
MVSLPKILAISGCMMVQAGTMLDKLKATQVPQGHKEQLDLQEQQAQVQQVQAD